jgi:hypothetical protein
MPKRTKVLAFILLLISIGTAGSYIAFSEPTPVIVIPKQTTYYMQGQRKNCLWVLQTLDSLNDKTNSMTRIAIGIPSATKLGLIKGAIQVSKGNQLLLAFAMPGMEKYPPIILSADIPSDLPAKTLSFRWLGSDTYKMNLFHTQEACLESTAEWKE